MSTHDDRKPCPLCGHEMYVWCDTHDGTNTADCLHCGYYWHNGTEGRLTLAELNKARSTEGHYLWDEEGLEEDGYGCPYVERDEYEEYSEGHECPVCDGWSKDGKICSPGCYAKEKQNLQDRMAAHPEVGMTQEGIDKMIGPEPS